MAYVLDDSYVKNSGFNVAMIVANGVRGDSRVLKTACSLSKRGFRVHLFGVDNISRTIEVEGYPFRVTLAPNPIFQLKKEGRWWITENQPNIELYIDRLVAVFMAASENRSYDFLHTHDMYGLPVGGKLRERSGIGEAGWVHDLHEYVEGCTNIPEYTRRVLWEQEKSYIGKPDALTTVSPILSKLIAERYEVAEPSLVLNTPRLSDFDSFHPSCVKTSLEIGKEVPLLVYNGGLKPERGIHYAVQALPLLPEVQLVLVTNSKGEYLNQLLKTAVRNGSANRLHIHPYVPYYDVTSFIRGATLGINPVTLYENSDLALPNKLFEYIHAGLPVVSSATTAMCDFLRNNECGMTYPVGDVKGFAEATNEMFARYPEGIRNAAESSQLARRYSWEEQEKILWSIYGELTVNRVRAPTEENVPQAGPILHLPTYAANQPGTMARAIRRSGANATSAALGANKFQYESDITIEPEKLSLSSVRSYFSEQGLDKYKTYHFHVRPLLFNKHFNFPSGLDLLLLKAMGKRVMFHFRGSEMRLRSIFRDATSYNYVEEQENSKANSMLYPFKEVDQIAFRDFVYGVCDEVFVNDPEMQTYAPNALIVPRVIDLEGVSDEFEKRRSIPLIVHAPSRAGVKGTRFIDDAIRTLRTEGYRFEFWQVENASHKEVMRTLREASIIIDQLRIGWYGVAAVEGMALGKAVISYVRNDLRHYLPVPPPLAYANPENITEVIRYLLENPEAVTEYGRAARQYVEEQHNAAYICEKLVKLYSRPVRPIEPEKVSDFLLHHNVYSDPKRGEAKHGTRQKVKDERNGYKLAITVARSYIRDYLFVSRTKGIWVATKMAIDVLKDEFGTKK